MRHRLLRAGSIAALAVMYVAACGDDKAAPPQTVLWFGLSAAGGARCSSLTNYQLPTGTARATVTSMNAVGERIEDGGDNLVECDVRPVSGSTTNFNVSVRFSGGEIGNFLAEGVLAEGMQGEVDVIFTTGAFSLAQERCTATVSTLRAGAVWIRSLRCPDLRDASSPGIICDGQGGVIFENCTR